MKIDLILQRVTSRIGPNHGIVITNGQPNKITVSGTPRSYASLQPAISVIREHHPEAEIDLKPALEHLRNRPASEPTISLG